MPKMNRMTGAPWHPEKMHRAEGDKVRSRTLCIYYDKHTKRCSKIMQPCFGSAHCEYYKEEDIQLSAENEAMHELAEMYRVWLIEQIQGVQAKDKTHSIEEMKQQMRTVAQLKKLGLPNIRRRDVRAVMHKMSDELITKIYREFSNEKMHGFILSALYDAKAEIAKEQRMKQQEQQPVVGTKEKRDWAWWEQRKM